MNFNRRLKIGLTSAIVCSSVFYSCLQNKESPPFPSGEMEYQQPTTKKITFPEVEPIVWDSTKTIQLGTLPTQTFDLDKLPSTPFIIDDITNIEGKIQEEPFDFNALPTTPFNLDSLPSSKIKINLQPLGEPEILDAGLLTVPQNSSRGVQFSAGSFGLTEIPNHVLTDEDGILWLVTNSNIARYDSNQLEIYGRDQGLALNGGFNLFQDSSKRFWVSGRDKIWILDLTTKLVGEILIDFPIDQIFGFIEDKEGNIWCSISSKGYYIFNLEKNLVKAFTQENGLSGPIPQYIQPIQDSEGLFWLSSFNGIDVLNLKDNSKKVIKFETPQDSLRNIVISITEDSAGKIWIGSFGGASFIDKENNVVGKFPIEEKSTIVPFIYEDSEKNIWLASNLGFVKKYSPTNHTVEKIYLNKSDDEFVIRPLVEDYQGNIWATPKFGGQNLYQINLKDGRPGNFNAENGLVNKRIRANLKRDDGTIWIGTSNGINIYNPSSKSLKVFPDNRNILPNSNPYLFTDSKNRIWTFGSFQGFSIINTEDETIKYITTNEGLPTRYRYLTEDLNNQIWIGGVDGDIIVYNEKENNIKGFQVDSVGSGYSTYFLKKDSYGNIWTATNGVGLIKIDPNKKVLQKFTTEHGLLSNQVKCLYILPNDKIWVASDNGAQIIDFEHGITTNFQTEQGLSSNDAYDINYNDNKTYIGTLKGISIIEPKTPNSKDTTWTVKNIGREQGLKFLDVFLGSSTFDEKGRFWIGIENEILAIIDDFNTDSTSLKTEITGLRIFDEKIDFNSGKVLINNRIKEIKELTHSDTISSRLVNVDETAVKEIGNIEYSNVEGPHNLPSDLILQPNQNFLSFNYQALEYSNPNSVVYRYFLEGIDKTWSDITNETSSENYRDLPPGDYTFKVAAKGYNNLWSEPAEFSFTIVPPWYKTWWAYLAYIILLTLILYSIVNYRSKWLKRENKILEERVNHRTAQLKKSIEDLEATQSQLIQSEKMASLGELTAGIAHEIQNPLNFVNNFAEVNVELIEELKAERHKPEAERDLNLEEELLRDIAANEEKIKHHGKRADAIVKGMLQHSRNSSSDKELTDINKLADEYMRLSYHGLRARDKTFVAGMNMDLDESIPQIYVAPQDIGRVLLNLINNAFYAVNEKKKTASEDYKPSVTVSTRRVNDQIEINVRDNGNGIPQDVIDKIFQPFFTTKPSGQGTGLGLSLSYDIIKSHGGTLTVRTLDGSPIDLGDLSESELKNGTIFTILLPIKTKDKIS